MEKELFVDFIASYLYNKGYEDAKSGATNELEYKNLSEYIKEGKKAYEVEKGELRKENPHHYTNRLD